ncbi:MAG TPA: lysylphosphatidylglycerol synthase transmembrane domain-containing protein [Cyclobacteriaceae bacterium]
MVARLKAVLKYLLILSATTFLIWFSLRGINVEPGEDKWDYLVRTWSMAHKGWLFFMALIAVASHIIRAERWRMLLVPAGYKTTLTYSFLSLMVGYLINLVVPRGGEVSRCYNLYKLDKTPVEISFGTVVVERIVDLLCLLVLIVVAFIIESEKLFKFLNTLPWSFSGQESKLYLLLALIAAVILFGVIFYLILKKNKKIQAFVAKTWLGFKEGLLSVFKLENKGLFIFHSLAIWFLYFLMSYAVIKAFPQTEHLGFSAVLSLFAIGSIAMAAPLPGGAGSYHVLVPKGLVFLYLIPESDAVAFTFIFHGWQTAIMIVMGAIAVFVSSLLMKKN